MTATINGDSVATVASGSSVDVAVSATKSGSGCDNNWRSTIVSVGGDQVIEEVLGSITGTGEVNDSFSFTAPTEPGEYTVLVEVMGGGESFGETVCNDEQVWGSVELTLTVYTPVEPFINMLSISPIAAERTVGDTDGLVYEAEVQIGGVPTSAHLQCVMFDIFRGDGWNPVTVDFSDAGTYNATDGISFSYDISGFATGTYDVVVVALDTACDNLPEDFSTADYLDSEVAYAVATTLTIVDEPVVMYCEDEAAINYSGEGECMYAESYTIYGYVWNDVNENGPEVPEPEEGESGIDGRIVTINNGEEGDGYVEFSTETDESGYYQFFVPAGTWTISDGETEDTTQTYPINEGNVHVVTVPELYSKADLESETFLASVMNWLVPTAYAVYYESYEYGPYNFGNKEVVIEEPQSSSRSTGTRVGERRNSGTPAPRVLGASTSATQCGVLIYDYLRLGQTSSTWEIMKLQMFLTGQGFYTPATGIFDAMTDANVRLFQAKYATEILAPWDITEPTGYVYKTTLWKLNNLVCPGSQAMPVL